MQKERVSIFIDWSNLYHNLKRHDINITFQEIINKLETKREVTDIFYYTALLDKKHDLDRYNKHKKFLDKIKKIPNFNIVFCNLKKIINEDSSISFEIKSDDIYLATDLIKGAYEDLYDVAIIVSGDEDFVPAIKLAQKNNKKVINAFFPKSSSYLLRDCCNGSVNLKKALSRKPKK
ncbi:MAG: NYN domain-containing protein [Candidatus Nanoarchaeia archaeon]